VQAELRQSRCELLLVLTHKQLLVADHGIVLIPSEFKQVLRLQFQEVKTVPVLILDEVAQLLLHGVHKCRH
jgi:hypothetical protein